MCIIDPGSGSDLDQNGGEKIVNQKVKQQKKNVSGYNPIIEIFFVNQKIVNEKKGGAFTIHFVKQQQ